jgi:DNA-binding FadR family transcriptional regulator
MASAEPPLELDLSLIPRHKLAERVAAQLLERIRSKGLSPGTRLPSERELQAAFGVGRSTVREAVNGLAMLGVVEIRHGAGVFVAERAAPHGADAVAAALARGVTHELFEARRVVEVEAARLAAERRSDAELRELADILDEHTRLAARHEPAVEPSVAFHLTLAAAAHNEVLAGFVASFAGRLSERGPLLEQIAGFPEWEIAQHRSVYEPVRSRNPGLAARRMRAHLDAVVGYHERIGLD